MQQQIYEEMTAVFWSRLLSSPACYPVMALSYKQPLLAIMKRQGNDAINNNQLSTRDMDMFFMFFLIVHILTCTNYEKSCFLS